MGVSLDFLRNALRSSPPQPAPPASLSRCEDASRGEALAASSEAPTVAHQTQVPPALAPLRAQPRFTVRRKTATPPHRTEPSRAEQRRTPPIAPGAAAPPIGCRPPAPAAPVTSCCSGGAGPGVEWSGAERSGARGGTAASLRAAAAGARAWAGQGRARRCPVVPGGLGPAAAMGDPRPRAVVLLPLLCLCAALPGSASNKGERRSAAGTVPGSGGGGAPRCDPPAAPCDGDEGHFGSSIRPRGGGAAPRCPSPSADTFLSGGLRSPRRPWLSLPPRAPSSHPLSLLSPSVSCHCFFSVLSSPPSIPLAFSPFHPLVLLLFQLSLC